ncbi:MAG: sugar transferase [Abitibacteriaceae bacterium]|nr:sugar transferase [Abditibacteriaceae bacterium]MBV9868589.1 sugar transferase [Abditibacteriaceae bacterium]
MNSSYRRSLLGDMPDHQFGSVQVLERAPREGGRIAEELTSRAREKGLKGLAKLRKKQYIALPPRRMLIVGANEKGQTLAKELTVNFPSDYAVIGFVDDQMNGAATEQSQILGRRAELDQLVHHHQIDEVVIADCLTENFDADGHYIGGAYEHSAEIPKSVASTFNRATKRAFDIIVSMIALIIGAPIAALVAIGTKLTSPGPIFYTQERVGRGGRIFTIYKLRSMHLDAEQGGPMLSRRDDDRTTPLGKILRATHMDEWPQFYNVLIGDMSIVGPRPERMCFVEKYNRYIPAYPQRHMVRPGITGLAQVNAGYLTHAYVKLHFDLEYIYNQSLWLDIWILAKTPFSILKTLRRKEI